MAQYRLYCTIKDEWGSPSTQRVGKVYGDVKKAIAAARKVSQIHGVAELRDDSRSVYDRLLAVFRDGREVQSRLDFG